MGARFLGWDVEFKDSTNNLTYTTEIVDLAIGADISSSIVMCTIKFLVDASFIKYFLKKHEGTLTLTNKLIYTDDSAETFMVDLQSVSNFGSVIGRDTDMKQPNNIIIPIRYMCKSGLQLLNARVGGIYEKKKLEEIIQDLYSQSKCDLPLKLEKLENQNKYESIHVQESSFTEAIRYLNNQYGFYSNMLLNFGDTFYDNSPEWVINNINKIKREEVKLYFLQYDQSIKKENKGIDDKVYYTYIPINIKNNFTQIIKKIPMMAKFISFDNERFMKRKDIPFSKTLKELNFLSSNDQFDQLMELETKMYSGSRMDQTNYSIKDMIQRVGMTAYQIPQITIPNPFKLSHFKIGTTINFISQSTGFIDADVKLKEVGWFLRIKQGNEGNGGSVWNTQLKIRTCATSYMESN